MRSDMGNGIWSIILLFCSCLIMMVSSSFALVDLEGGDFQYTFDDVEANFAPPVKTGGICGKLYIAEPLDACSPLTNIVDHGGNYSAPFALIIRGGCGFEDKVRKAQKAGFEAAIIYDNEDDGILIAMAGNSAGIRIHAIFVSKATGETLKTYAGLDYELWIIPNESSAWSIMVISFISLLAMSAALAVYFFVKRLRVRRERPEARIREFHGMSDRLVKAMPSLIFTTVTEDYCTSSTCAICLEDYVVGDRLRVLPCRHKFHAQCVDFWLCTWRTFCPVCKRDAKSSNDEPPASESTPLLSSNPSSIASSPSSSFRSRSSAIRINSPSPRTHATPLNHSIPSSPQIPRHSDPLHHQHFPSMSVSRSSMDLRNLSSQRLLASQFFSPNSLSRSPLVPGPLRSFHHQNPPSMSVSRSSTDLRNMSSQRSLASQLISPHSMGYPSASPFQTRYMSPYIPSPSVGSPASYLGSSVRHQNALHHSESATSFSPYASAQSLPGCD
ncbi:receptor homology region, transmembrane domain- and RING domain-containing protein 2-like [Silene latifolia]|uniref:receptor homology region, transmembrane domain- and RING domain-containing protein 2-like n=1 Tax=Silene latifolia TaxID=37657 RepID=UPI003D77C1E1